MTRLLSLTIPSHRLCELFISRDFSNVGDNMFECCYSDRKIAVNVGLQCVYIMVYTLSCMWVTDSSSMVGRLDVSGQDFLYSCHKSNIRTHLYPVCTVSSPTSLYLPPPPLTNLLPTTWEQSWQVVTQYQHQ